MHEQLGDAKSIGRLSAEGVWLACVPVDVAGSGPFDFRHIQTGGPSRRCMFRVDGLSDAAPHVEWQRNGVGKPNSPHAVTRVVKLDRQAKPTARIVGQRDL